MNNASVKKLSRIFLSVLVLSMVSLAAFSIIRPIVAKTLPPPPALLEELSATDFDDISRIETNANLSGRIAVNEFNNTYRANTYLHYDYDLPSSPQTTYRCYDASDNLLFTLTDYNSDDIIELTIGDESDYYQKQ